MGLKAVKLFVLSVRIEMYLGDTGIGVRNKAIIGESGKVWNTLEENPK